MAPYMRGKLAIGKIDCTKQQKICGKDRFNVKGYPTLKIYRDGVFMDYPGERHADAFIDFGEKMSRNAVSVVHTYQEAVDTLLSSNREGVAFVAYDPKASGDTLEDMLQSTAVLQIFSQIARKQQAFATFGLLSPSMTAEQVSEFGVGDATEVSDFSFINNLKKSTLFRSAQEDLILLSHLLCFAFWSRLAKSEIPCKNRKGLGACDLHGRVVKSRFFRFRQI